MYAIGWFKVIFIAKKTCIYEYFLILIQETNKQSSKLNIE